MWRFVFIPAVAIFGCLFRGVRVLCVKCQSTLQLFLVSFFGLVSVNCHWWVRFFWPVAGTDAHNGLLFFMSGSHLGPLGEVASYWFIMLCVCGTWCMHCVEVVFGIFSLFCYVIMGEKVIIIILSQHYPHEWYISQPYLLEPAVKLLLSGLQQ